MSTSDRSRATDQPLVPQWTNWQGNQRFSPRSRQVPTDEAMVADTVRGCRRSKVPVRVAGSGHSNTPIVQTDGILLDLTHLSGVVETDRQAATAVIRAGTRIADIGEPLWRAGMSLHNQGDTDSQTLAGAVATGTKGSGLTFGSLSASIVGMRLVDGTGRVVVVDQSTPELLSAAQVSLGLLGVVTELTMSVAPAYHLREDSSVKTFDELMGLWQSGPLDNRHFSFLWAPSDSSSDLYGLPQLRADEAWVKTLTEIAAPSGPDGGEQVTGGVGTRSGPAYRVYPDIPDDSVSDFLELEYMVDRADAQSAFLALRHLMTIDFPNEVSPVQVRWQQADSGLLSAQYRQDTVSISVSSDCRAGDGFLRAVDSLLHRWAARPHWGKMNFLTPVQVRSCYPGLESFLQVRSEMDPDGVFLTPYFRHLFGIET